MNRKHIFTATLVGILTVFIGYFLFVPGQLNVGTELPDAPALFETSLAAPITSTASTMTLTSNSVRGGGSLSGYNCFTIDEGSAQAEFVCGTASSTSVTGLVRGISPSDGTTADTDLQFSHRRGASVKITDFPIVQILRNQNNGDATFENVLRYAASVVPNGASDLADVGYVLSVVNGGAVNFDALVVAGTAGETVATGTVVYFDGTDQEWKKVDTDTSTTYQNVPVGIAQGAGVNGGSIGGGGVLLAGLDETQTSMTIGSTYYASTTAGGIGLTANGMRLGKAKSATQLYVTPVLDMTFVNNTWVGTNSFAAEALEIGLVSMTAGATINGGTLPVPVYASSTDSEVYAMDANVANAQNFVGFAVTNSTNGNSILIQTSGVVDGFSGLTANKQYYVQDTVGTIGSTIGTYEMVVGNSISTTEVKIKSGRRYSSGTFTVGDATTAVALSPGFKPARISIYAVNTTATEPSHTVVNYLNGVTTGIYMGANGTANITGLTPRLYDSTSLGSNYMTFSVGSITDTGFTITYTETGTYDQAGSVLWEAEGEM